MGPLPNSESEPSSRSSSSPNSPPQPFQIHVLTLFPESLESPLQSSLLGKAQERGILKIDRIQIRDFATDTHRTVDDSPFGGGEGMVLRADVLHRAWASAKAKSPHARTLLLSPQGKTLTSAWARELAQGGEPLILVCGHYEGVDERFVELCVDEEISIGDYVLTGGELPALVLIDAVSRWIPGVVGKEQSVAQDSFEGGTLKYPQYTRPRVYEGLEVPEVLLSGDHGRIAEWRSEARRERTRKKRPDLG